MDRLFACLLHKTAGFLNLQWTALSLACFFVSLGMIALLLKKGFALSIVIPLISGMAPLAISVIAIGFFGEAGSLLKIVLLVAACGMIGLASTIKAQEPAGERE